MIRSHPGSNRAIGSEPKYGSINRRYGVCSGGSMAVKVRTRSWRVSVPPPGLAPSEMPRAEEKSSQLPSTARTSSYLVIDQ